MQYITPEEATHIAYIATGANTIYHAKEIFDHCYQAPWWWCVK